MINLFWRDEALTATLGIVGGLLTITIAVVIAAGAIAQQEVNSRSVAGAICVYVLFGMVFMFVFGVLATLGKTPFFAQGIDGTRPLRLYFSYVTLATLGYGDYTAAGNLGRALAVLEALMGQLYLVTVVAVVVTRLGRPGRGASTREKESEHDGPQAMRSRRSSRPPRSPWRRSTPSTRAASPGTRCPADELPPDVAYQIVHDELMLDGNARLNVATFVSTWMEPQAERLMAECLDKNMIDKDEYPQTAALEARCVNILANLWHAPDERQRARRPAARRPARARRRCSPGSPSNGAGASGAKPTGCPPTSPTS